MHIDSKELEEYLAAALSAIAGGVKRAQHFRLVKPVVFDLAVTNKKSGKGRMQIFVATAQGKLKTEEISRIKIEVHPQHQPSEHSS